MTPPRFDVWTWTRDGRRARWTLELEAAPLLDACRAVVAGGRCSSSAAFPFELEANPNRMTADELADLAQLTAGPIPDVLGGAAA